MKSYWQVKNVFGKQPNYAIVDDLGKRIMTHKDIDLLKKIVDRHNHKEVRYER